MRDRRLGLFGGTFDPPHFGHVAALEAAAHGRFDRIEVTVAGDPYSKEPGVLLRGDAPRHGRTLPLTTLHSWRSRTCEIRREPGRRYTIDTVRELLVNADAVDLIVGADLATQLDNWHEAEEFRELVEVGVVPRPGSSSIAPNGWRSYEIEMHPVDLSSTFIREMAPSGTKSEKVHSRES